jgi:hypothetical protein
VVSQNNTGLIGAVEENMNRISEKENRKRIGVLNPEEFPRPEASAGGSNRDRPTS